MANLLTHVSSETIQKELARRNQLTQNRESIILLKSQSDGDLLEELKEREKQEKKYVIYTDNAIVIFDRNADHDDFTLIRGREMSSKGFCNIFADGNGNIVVNAYDKIATNNVQCVNDSRLIEKFLNRQG